MAQPYRYDDVADCFVIEQYNDRVPFAGFLPGVAGSRGRPAWVFYVNRGQAVASLGVRNKDGAFLEFHPADKAWQLTPERGFRTFVEIIGSADRTVWEPFQCGAAAGVRQRMYRHAARGRRGGDRSAPGTRHPRRHLHAARGRGGGRGAAGRDRQQRGAGQNAADRRRPAPGAALWPQPMGREIHEPYLRGIHARGGRGREAAFLSARRCGPPTARRWNG